MLLTVWYTQDTLHALSGIPMRSREEFANFTNILKDYQPLLVRTPIPP